jgi:phage FluMu gp28-like protein
MSLPPSTRRATAPSLVGLTNEATAAAPPPALLPYQQRWVADTAQLKIAEKGRRIGLTWGEAADDVLIASTASGSNVYYISATEDMAREYIEAAAMWARAFNVAANEVQQGLFADEGKDGADRQIKTFEVTFPRSGHRIVALSSRPANLRGKQGVIVIDEAAFAPDLPGLLKAALAMLMWGDRVRIISTHDGADNRFAQLIEEVRAGKRGRATVHTIRFMDAVRDGLYRRVCLRKGRQWTQEAEDAWVDETYAFYGTDAREELDAIPNASGGAYISLTHIAARMVPAWSSDNPTGPALVRGQWDDGFAMLSKETREYAIRGWIAEQLQPHLDRMSPLLRHAIGGDFARTMDLSVWAVGEEQHDLVKHVPLIIELRNCPFSSQEQILKHVIGYLQRKRFCSGAGDASGNGAALGEALQQEFGSQLYEAVKISAQWYVENMPKLRAALQDGTTTGLPRDDQIRDDLRAVQLINGVPRVPAVNTASDAARAKAAEDGAGKGGKRHGDAAVALCMLEYAWTRDLHEIAWTPIPATASRWSERAPDSHTHRLSGPPPDDLDDLAEHFSRLHGSGGW